MTRRRRRKIANTAAEAVAWLASAAAVAVLAIVVVSVALKGVPALSGNFFMKAQSTDFFDPGAGGVAHALVGSLVLVAVAAAIAIPLGILVAIYVTEFARPRVAPLVRTALDVLNGVPSIVIGIFVYALLVIAHKQNGFFGSFALAIIMLPLVSRSAQEVLALVPQSLREASQALGVSKWRTVLRIVLPAAVGGIMTGATLAVARAAGETAPLLFASSLFDPNRVSLDPSRPLASIPLTIYTYSEQPDPALHHAAWGAAFVLIVFVLVTSLAARLLLYRSRRRLAR